MHIYNHTLSGHDTVSEATPSLHSGQALFQQAQAGCRASLNALMAHHDGLVQAVVRRQVLGDLPFAEALQAGRIGLWRAIQGYDPKHGTAFSTYAWPCIVRHVWRAVKMHSRFHSLPVTGDGLPPLAGSDPILVWEAAVVGPALWNMTYSTGQAWATTSSSTPSTPNSTPDGSSTCAPIQPTGPALSKAKGQDPLAPARLRRQGPPHLPFRLCPQSQRLRPFDRLRTPLRPKTSQVGLFPHLLKRRYPRRPRRRSYLPA